MERYDDGGCAEYDRSLDRADELTGYEEHLRDSQFLGDARRCPRHPSVKTSSDDGMFDVACGACEAEMYDAGVVQDFAASRTEAGSMDVSTTSDRKTLMQELSRLGWNVVARGNRVVWSRR